MLQSSPENLELLLQVSLLLSSKLDLSELLTTIMLVSAQVVKAETASLLLVDPKTDELYFDVALGLDPEISRVRLKMGQGIAGGCAQEGKTLVINDVRQDPRWSSTMDKWSGFVTRSILAAPMKVKGKVTGVIEAINRINGTFTPEDIRIFEAFASQAAVAVENARLFHSLKEEKARLDTVFAEMTDGAVLTEESGKITLSNQAAVKCLAVGGGAPGSIQEGLSAFAVKPPVQEVLGSREPLLQFEAVREVPKLLILAGTASAVEFEQIGTLPASRGRLLIFRDVTAARQEETLKRSFLSLISHKLKTPLASITGYSQILIDEMAGKDLAPILLKAAKTVSTQGNKLSQHVDKLLNYTVLEELKEGDLALRAVAIDDIMAEAAGALTSWLDDNHGSVVLKTGSGLSVHGDPLLLRDVLKNLIENGVKFNACEPRMVTLWAEARDGLVEVHVQDKGPGIPPEEQDRIFDKFYQIESSFTGQVDGWGLGLPFVKKVVEQHGGSVRLASRLGEGTTVVLTLPPPSAGAEVRHPVCELTPP